MNKTGKEEEEEKQDELTCGEMNRRDQLNEEEEADNEGRLFQSEMKRSATILGRGFFTDAGR